MQPCSEFGHLLFDILVLGAFLLQLLFHLVERLHHVLFLLGLRITFTLLLLKPLLQLVVFCERDITGSQPFIYLRNITQNHAHLFSSSPPAPSIV